MDHVMGHLVRRATDIHAQWRASPPAAGKMMELEIPTWGKVLLGFTVFMGLMHLMLIEYTYGKLIATLAMVESPTAVVEAIPSGEPDAPLDEKKSPEIELDLVVIKQKPITAKFRTTLKHLREKTGSRFSRLRGLQFNILHTILLSWLVHFFAKLHMPMGVDAILAATILSRISMAWTHVAITNKSDKPWYRRFPSLKLWKKVAIPTAIHAAAQQVTILVPAGLAIALDIPKIKNSEILALSCSERYVLIGKILAVITSAMFCAVCVVIPANVALTRVQASLLADEEETIVPFDRSFGGRVAADAKVSMLDAWKTFTFAQRLRLVKIYLKVVAMQLAVVVKFVLIFALQLYIITGMNVRELVAQAKN